MVGRLTKICFKRERKQDNKYQRSLTGSIFLDDSTN